MTSSATGPDSAFFPEETLPRVTPPARLNEDDARASRPGHDAGPTQWLQNALAIWLAPDDAPCGDDSDTRTGGEHTPGRPASAH